MYLLSFVTRLVVHYITLSILHYPVSYVPSGVGPGVCVGTEIPGLYIGMHPKNINGFFFSS